MRDFFSHPTILLEESGEVISSAHLASSWQPGDYRGMYEYLMPDCHVIILNKHSPCQPSLPKWLNCSLYNQGSFSLVFHLLRFEKNFDYKISFNVCMLVC